MDLSPIASPRLSPLEVPHTASSKHRNLNIFNLPRNVRNQIYHHILHDDTYREHDAEHWSDWSCRTPPQVPAQHLGLLRVCHRVYDEASEVLYQTVDLGSNAQSASNYLTFIGHAHRQQIRHLTLRYECHGTCRLEGSQRDALNWMPIFELLTVSQSGLRSVDIYFTSCGRGWSDGNFDVPYLETRCRLEWQEETDHFWRGLRTLTTVHEIHFKSAVPEYFAHLHARQLGWHLQGNIIKHDWATTVDYLPSFLGKITNPTYYTDLHPPNTTHPSSTTHPVKTTFLTLPLDLRLEIYDHACAQWTHKPFWPVHPARWNSGVSLLATNKQIAAEARPAVFRTFHVRIPGSSVSNPLAELVRPGRDIVHVRRMEVQFSCFCPWGGEGLRGNSGTVFAREAAASVIGGGDWGVQRALEWRPGEEVVRRYVDFWREVVGLIRAQRGIAELEVTFLSCCRSAWTVCGWSRRESRQYRACCLESENQFLDLLEGCCGVEKISLAGNVPPSSAVRMQQTSWAVGQRMELVMVSDGMKRFVEEVETEWETQDGERPWRKTVPYPQQWDYALDSAVTHFVLEKRDTSRDRWARFVGLGRRENGAKEVERFVRRFSSRSWKTLRGVLDYDNVLE